MPSMVETGVHPIGGMIFDGAGNLYGSTLHGGDNQCDCGTVFELSCNAEIYNPTVSSSFSIYLGIRMAIISILAPKPEAISGPPGGVS